MATVTITITDAPGGGGAMFVVESKPDIPLVDRLGTPDVDKLTDAQTIAIGAMMAICEQVKQPDFRVFLR
jgi:hypothetical protein